MSDRLYVTSAKIIREYLGTIEKFLTNIARLGDFRGLPVHAEVRIDEQGRALPIEINPLRFAGWCSTDIGIRMNSTPKPSETAGIIPGIWENSTKTDISGLPEENRKRN